jgi:hypothetical protein
VELLVAQLSRASSHSQMSQSTFRTSIHAIRQLCTSCDAYERAIHSRSKKIGTLHSRPYLSMPDECMRARRSLLPRDVLQINSAEGQIV